MDQTTRDSGAAGVMDPPAAAAAAASATAARSSGMMKKVGFAAMPKTVHFNTTQVREEGAVSEEPSSGSPASFASSDAMRRGRRGAAAGGGPHMKIDIPTTDPATVFSATSHASDDSPSTVPTPNTPLTPIANAQSDEAPEKRITLVVVRLTILEKAATSIGTLTFVWATVILLGGFSTFLEAEDFWLITVLLCTEGARIFSRSHELEWQHAAAGSSLSIFHLPKWLNQAGAAVVRIGSDVVHNSARFVSDHVPQQRNGAITRIASGSSPTESDDQLQITKPNLSKRARQIAEVAHAQSLQRRLSKHMVQLVPWLAIFSAKTVSLLMSYLQIASALFSVAISLYRLSTLQDFHTTTDNVKLSLYAFYSMSFLEASIFLLERSYWYCKIRWGKLLENVKDEAGLGNEDYHVEFLRTFFYEVYAKCLSGSVFDGLDMDLVGYSLGLIQSDDSKQVLDGIRVLKALAYHKSINTRNDTFRHIGVTIGAVDRLVEMLAWCNPNEIEIRRHAAAVVRQLVLFTRNCSRVAAVVGSLQNIASLLYYADEDVATHYPDINDADSKVPPLPVVELQTYGLGILRCLASDHALCLRIGETRGLLPILVENIEVHSRITQIPGDLRSPCRKTIKKSLKLLMMLAGTTGESGKVLRPLITNVVSTIPRVRDILQYKEKLWDFQQFAVEILTNLALDETSRETIGSTGGVIKALMSLLARRKVSFRSSMGAEHDETPMTPKSSKDAENEELVGAVKAGQALTRLVLKNKKNCQRILKLNFTQDNMNSLDILIQLLEIEEVAVANSAAKILRSIFAYTNEENERSICKASEFLMAKVVETSDEAQEAALGLVAKSMPLVHDDEFKQIWASKVSRQDVVNKLLDILKHAPTTTRSPCRRRYAIELIIALLKRDEEFQPLFIDSHLVVELNRTLLSISDVENFLLFSGGAGLVRHSEEMEDLIEKALHILNPPMMNPPVDLL